MAVWGRIRLLVLNQRESIEVLPTPGRSRRLLPLLVFLYAGSGCAALVYEIVWFQLLQLVIGSSAVSLGLLLAAYMGGLCVGSALLPRAISREYQPLRLSAFSPLPLGEAGATARALSRRVRVTGLTKTCYPHLFLRLRPIGLALRALLNHGSSTPSSLFPGAQPSVRKSCGRVFCR